MSYNKLPPAPPPGGMNAVFDHLFQMQAGNMQAKDPYERPPLNDTSLALYERAVQDPGSLTDAERRTILERSSEQEEDALCRQRTGLSYDDILQKASTMPDELTYEESYIAALSGPEPRELHWSGRNLATMKLPQDQRQLV